jgi:hypothetical protein
VAGRPRGAAVVVRIRSRRSRNAHRGLLHATSGEGPRGPPTPPAAVRVGQLVQENERNAFTHLGSRYSIQCNHLDFGRHSRKPRRHPCCFVKNSMKCERARNETRRTVGMGPKSGASGIADTDLGSIPGAWLVQTNAADLDAGPSAWPPSPGLPATPPPREPYPLPPRTPNDPSPFRRSPYLPRRDRGRPLIICRRGVTASSAESVP